MALDLFLSPLISLVVDKAADSLIQQLCQMWGMEDNRKKLHRQLLAIQELTADAEAHQENNRAVQEWMKELQLASFKAVDVLDEFKYEALRREAIRQQPSSSAKAVKSFFSGENQILFRQKMSNKLKKILEMIDEIVTEMNTFNLVPRNINVPTIIDRESQSFVTESEVIGRESEHEKIVNLLLDPQRERDGISVLPIVAMGGMGKTSLAQLIYNDVKIKGHFQLPMWICVSTEFNVVNIIKSIIQVAEKKSYVSTSNKEVLQQHLREILDQKKYLLVLDDVWNEEEERWVELKTLLFSRASAGSVVIVTTRSKGVASIMGTLPNHNLVSLTEEDSWKLFKKRVLGAGLIDLTEELTTIGRTIVRKCGGLPLAVKAMGGLMGTKPDVRDWCIVAENKIWDGLASAHNILPLLKLSYDHLPSYIKQCFTFCAVFPQDYVIERDTLIQLWMANDFIPTDGTMDLEDKGRHIFNELYWRSFFQEISEKYPVHGSIITFKMHDLMHDLATQVSRKKCYTQLKLLNNPEVAQEEVQHLFVSKLEYLEVPIRKQFPTIHTLLVYGDPDNSIDNPIENHFYLVESSSLRALKYKSYQSPPKELGYLKHLRYLDLSYSRFDTLPQSMSKLYNLQTLNLSHTHIRELPDGLRYMINLRHLFLNSCSHLERMPSGIGQLKCLRILTKYIVNPDEGVSIGELTNLNLCGHLSLSGLKKVRDKREAELFNLLAKPNLHSLELEWEPLCEIREKDQVVLEAFRPHNELKFLYIIGFCGSSFPNWMKEPLIIKNLKILQLKECFNCLELPPLWQLPLLEELCLDGMKSLKFFVGCGTSRNADGSEPLITFPSMINLEMKRLSNLEGWHNEKDFELIKFPNLNRLRIKSCPKLKTIPLHAPLLSSLSVIFSGKIKMRQISNVPMLSYLYIQVRNTPTETEAFRPPINLEEMTVIGLENVDPLESVEENQSCQANSLRKLTIENSHCFFSCGHGRTNKLAIVFWKQHFEALEQLHISRCNSLVYWPEEEFKSLKCLKKLDIFGCKKLTGLLSKSSSPINVPRVEDFLPLPGLELLNISTCPELVQVPVCSTSLKELTISKCSKLLQEGLAGLTNLTRLKLLFFERCTTWRALPENMRHLPSLKRLIICNCPEIESFSEDLQQRLPSLEFLNIKGSTALKRRCSQGGDYCHLVSPIPRIMFSHEEEEEHNNKSESIFRSLLPACTRS